MAIQSKNGIFNHPVKAGLAAIALLLIITVSISSCKHQTVTPAKPSTRTYRMGFQNFPPEPNTNSLVNSLNMWTQRADAAIISIQVPWGILYSGTKPDAYIHDNYDELVSYYRSKNLKLWVYIDPANGLDRSADATDLAALGKSIAQPDVQALYSRFTFLMDSLLKPEHIGLALETNLIRAQSSAGIYTGIKNAVNHTAAVIRSYDKNVKLSVSIQADYAWGVLSSTTYQGIDQDFVDFSFIQELGLSSYPYFVYDQPQDIPDNYYSRLMAGHNVPVFMSEGGWSSLTVGTYAETPQKQQDYITKQAQLLDGVKAIAWFQLLFSDLDTRHLPGTLPTDLGLFTHLGLTDTSLNAKPALTNWDAIFKRKLVSGN